MRLTFSSVFICLLCSGVASLGLFWILNVKKKSYIYSKYILVGIMFLKQVCIYYVEERQVNAPISIAYKQYNKPLSRLPQPKSTRKASTAEFLILLNSTSLYPVQTEISYGCKN